MADHFTQDLQRAQGVQQELDKIWEDRKKLAAEGKPTGRFDHKIRSKDNELKGEVVSLEKLIYFYQQNDKKYESVSTT